MKRTRNILLIISVMLFTAGILSAQELPTTPDSTVVQAQAGGNELQNREQVKTREQEQVKTQTRAQAQTGAGAGVKKVQSARPDWSKARGARPASVERPSGSSIPKGVGKPGGAKGPGKR